MPATATRLSLGKRNSSALASSSTSLRCVSMPIPPNKRAKVAPSPTASASAVDPAHPGKENIPPPQVDPSEREGSVVSPNTRVTRSRSAHPTRRRASSPGLFEASVDTLFTPPHTPSVEHDASRFDDMSIDLPIAAPDFTCSQDTPARAMAILSLVTPPITPSRTLHTLARTLLRSTTDSFAVVGRETERTFLSKFLQSFLDHTTTDAEECSEDLATSLYISGSPGTGKTALVKSVMTDLVDTRDDIRTAYINCMGLKDIEVLWGRILQAIGGATTSSKRTKAVSSSFTRLERRLSEDGFRCILVLDELDTFGPASLSAIFGLPARFPSTLRFIAISNDLTQSIKASSTLSLYKPSLSLAFPAYTAPEMQAIIRSRLAALVNGEESGTKADEKESPTEAKQIAKIILAPALTLLVRKVSALSGDIRYALEVLRRAIQIANPSSPSKSPSSEKEPDEGNLDGERPLVPVGMAHVVEAVKRASASSCSSTSSPAASIASTSSAVQRGPLHGCVASLSLQARLALITILVARRRAAHNLPTDSLDESSFTFSPSWSTPTAPSTPSRTKARRATSLGGTSPTKSSFSTNGSLTPSKLFTLYTHILAACPSASLDSVSRSEYADLLGVLETSSIIQISSSSSPSAVSLSSPSGSPSKRARKGASFGSMSAGVGGKKSDDSFVVLGANEGEVLRALLATTSDCESEAEGRNVSVLDREVGKIWERETRRVDRALANRARRIAEPAEKPVDREDYL